MEILNKKPTDFSTHLCKLVAGETFVFKHLSFDKGSTVYLKTDVKANDRIKVVDLSTGELTSMSYDTVIYKVDAKVMVDGYLPVK